MINNKRIIGSSKDIYKRWDRYKFDLKNNKFGNPHLQSSYNKYGAENFSYEIINECQEENFLELEDYYMIAFSTLDRKYGYNLKLASRPEHNDESRRKMSITRKGKKLSNAHRKSMSIAHKGIFLGKNNPNYGKHPSKETLEKMSRAMKGKAPWIKGKKHTNATKNKMKKAGKGRFFSELTRQRISRANIGKKRSNETRQKMSNSAKIKIFTKEHRKNLSIAGKNRSQEIKDLCVAKLKEYKANNPISEETRRKLSLANKGRKLKPMSEESKKKISIAHKGKKLSEEHKRKIRETKSDKSRTNFGKHWSVETRKKMSEAKKGKNHPNYGKLTSEETRNKIRESNKGRIPWNKGMKQQ